MLVVLVQIFGTLFFSLINGRRTEFRISQSEMFSAIGGMLVENVGGFFKNMFRNVYQGFTVQGNRPILRSRISIGSQLVGGFFNGLFRSMLQPFTAQRNRPLARSVAGLGSQSPTSSLPAGIVVCSVVVSYDTILIVVWEKGRGEGCLLPKSLC